MLNLLLKNGTVYENGALKKADVLIKDGIVAQICENIAVNSGIIVVDAEKFDILPGFRPLIFADSVTEYAISAKILRLLKIRTGLAAPHFFFCIIP